MIRLPIDQKIPEVLSVLKKASSLVLSAAPGAGKTTRLPPALLELTGKQVWVLEPRRVAAVAAAHRIAEENGWRVGEEVGYQVRFENKTGPKSRLVFLTEALLARKILQDPALENVGIVVLDEFHERSIHVDVALGLLKELQMLSRPDLKIVVMSATLDARPLSEFLDNGPVVDVPGRLFELEIQKNKASQLLRTDFRFIERVTEQIRAHISGYPAGKDVLVFLPGQSEISRCLEQLSDFCAAQNLMALPLTGSLNLADQMKVLRPQPQRKIILATNVAESSLTIDGVDTVIDSGLARILKRHPKTEFEQLSIARISRASARQRAGRAARQFPGRCYQLWNAQDEISMPDFEVAEIHRIDLAESVLFLKLWGAADVGSFSWFEKPPEKSLRSAERLLEKIGAVRGGQITDHGKKLAQVPLAPRIAHVLLSAQELGLSELGPDLCALLGERDLRVSENSIHDDDFIERLEALQAFRSSGQGFDRRGLQTVDRAAEQLRKYAQGRKGSYDLSRLGEILLLSFPDRLCRRRSKGRRQALMAGGRGVELAESSLVKKSEFFIAVDLMELENSSDTQVRRASAVDKNLIQKYFSKEIFTEKHLRFEEENGQFYMEEAASLWGLPLEEPRRRHAKPEEVAEYLPDVFVERWEQVLKENEELQGWWERWLFYEKKSGREPFWTDERKKLAFQQAALGHAGWSTVIGQDLVYFFESQIESKSVQEFHRRCPARIEVPTGNKIRLHYHLDKEPHLEVRLQELFGMAKTPAIWEGQVPVTLHLLGPNYRPVQMTSDLASFWRNTYAEVRKELRARYPKHSWPEDPLTAPPVAKGRPRK